MTDDTVDHITITTPPCFAVMVYTLLYEFTNMFVIDLSHSTVPAYSRVYGWVPGCEK